MQAVQRKKYVAREYQSRGCILARSVSSQRIVTGHVRMNYLNVVFARQIRKGGARCLRPANFAATASRIFSFGTLPSSILRAECGRSSHKDFVATFDETVCKVRQMALAATKRLGRTYLENSQKWVECVSVFDKRRFGIYTRTLAAAIANHS